MKYVIIVLILSASLSGCSPAISDLIGLNTAPDVIVYTPDQLKKASAEMSIGQCPTLNEFTVDYGVMRDQSRVLKGETVDIKR